MSADQLNTGYRRAYRDFYRWTNVLRAARNHATVKHRVKHAAYAAGWKKFEPVWNTVIRTRQLALARPGLEAVLSRVTAAGGPAQAAATDGPQTAAQSTAMSPSAITRAGVR